MESFFLCLHTHPLSGEAANNNCCIFLWTFHFYAHCITYFIFLLFLIVCLYLLSVSVSIFLTKIEPQRNIGYFCSLLFDPRMYCGHPFLSTHTDWPHCFSHLHINLKQGFETYGRVGQMWHAVWKTATPVYVYAIYGCFLDTRAKLSNYDRARKAWYNTICPYTGNVWRLSVYIMYTLEWISPFLCWCPLRSHSCFVTNKAAMNNLTYLCAQKRVFL